MRRLILLLPFLLTVPLSAQQAWPGRPGLENERCVAASGDGAELLARGAMNAGIGAINGALRFRGTETQVQSFQSDRMYQPFLQASNMAEFTFDPASASERARTLNPDGAPGRDLIRTPRGLLFVRDTTLVPYPMGFPFFDSQRPLNPLAPLVDFQRSGTAKVVAKCVFRDVTRTVLSRGTEGERLYLEARTGLPIKYERRDPHYLWGQVHAEYVYATWWQAGPAMLPMVAVRYIDGVEDWRRDVSLPQGAEPVGKSVALADAFPKLPAPLPDHSAAPDGQLNRQQVDTVRVGENTWLLKTPAYTHAVTMVRDTVYLFDATTGEWRGQADSAWIARFFPTARATVLVVTDLAWPHISGVRYWVSRGATIATHRMSRPFLQQLIDRSFTLKPDLLEAHRKGVRTRWILVDSTVSLAGGAIRLSGIDGPSSEGAVMAFLPAVGFLWAGDYVQDSSQPSVYAREVVAAAGRAGFQPTMVAAQHLPLTRWSTVLSANP